MLKDARIWTAAVALSVAAVLIGRFVIPVRPPAVAEAEIPEIRYVCRESGEVFTLRMAGEVLDDAKRKKWKPGPPLEIMHKKGLLKPAS